MVEFDRSREAAEAQLDRLDDEALDGSPPQTARGVVGVEDFGLHVEDPSVDLLVDEAMAEPVSQDNGEADVLDAAAEAFNARDLDGLLALLGPDGELGGLLGQDPAELPEVLGSLWQRRPTCCLTRGQVDDGHVGVLWDTDGSAWWRLAVLHVDDVVDGRAGVIELTDDPTLVERVSTEAPELAELEEGTRWSEWDEGAEGA